MLSLLVLVFPSRLITTGKSVEPMVQKEGRRLHGALMCFSTWWSCSLYMQSVTEYIHVLRVVFRAKPSHWRTALRTWQEIWLSRSHTLIRCTSTWLNNDLYTYSITGLVCAVKFSFWADVSTQESDLENMVSSGHTGTKHHLCTPAHDKEMYLIYTLSMNTYMSSKVHLRQIWVS